jgi:phosphoketolase
MSASAPRKSLARRAAELRASDPALRAWAEGGGPIRHLPETQVEIAALAEDLARRGIRGDGVPFFDLLSALDRLARAGMWLVAHQTYARRVHLDGTDLAPSEFKERPEGHMGGSLNMVPGYAGYLAANAISGFTRSWLVGQGHTVSALDSVNLLVGNTTPPHAARYDVSDEGLSRFCEDFYSYRLGPGGVPESPLGSHVNPNTAGGTFEGGYLGFAELQYVHMPLPGERLVVFLSDGAFEEQRGSDWAPRWWRAEDSGLVAPIMISNGRRIDQRTTMAQSGGVSWFRQHLRLNGFHPIIFDGRDPAAFVWAIFEMERRLEKLSEEVHAGRIEYPIPLPYGIAVAPKGAGFWGAGKLLAHNLPLGANPSRDATAARHFRDSARKLWVPPEELRPALEKFAAHGESGRVREGDHPLARRDVRALVPPAGNARSISPDRRDPARWTRSSPMTAVDETFLAVVRANPGLRPRVGNPDEMRSNRMLATLDALKFRVTAPEHGLPEAVEGAVITALNEEAIVCAALGNKGGINIVVTYEAFGMKMHGALRQEIVFSEELRHAGRPPGWLSVPIVLASHAWENAKNERSHQDPSLAEALLGESSDVSRVVFPADANSAAAAILSVFSTRGEIWTLVVPKAESVADALEHEEAERLTNEGAIALDWAGFEPERARLSLTAVGAYQLAEVLKASFRLAGRGVPHSVVYVCEPGRFRRPRTEGEARHVAPADRVAALWPGSVEARVFVTHTRPEVLLGVLAPEVIGPRPVGLGFSNRGGTLDTRGMLFVNRSSWAHALEAGASLLGTPLDKWLTKDELAALRGEIAPFPVLG